MSVINLIKTAGGYSVLQGNTEVNRVSGKTGRQKPLINSKKFAQQNFTIYPYISTKEVENNQKFIIFPVKSQWFNFNSIHQIQKKALPQWFKTRKVIFGSVKPDKFQKNEQLYKKYRNYIIDLGRNQYVSPTRARKGLAGDACSIIKIHQFLQKWGLVNFAFSKKESKMKTGLTEQKDKYLEKRKDCLDKDKGLYSKNFDKDDIELLKKITRKFRPYCHLCEGVCGIMWFQYRDKLFLKTYTKDSQSEHFKVNNSGQPFDYCFRVCVSCLDNGGIPVVLSIEDFTKITIYDQLEYNYEEPKEKKKILEENKLLDTIQRSKFNIKKTSNILKVQENILFKSLMSIPLIKLQKMSRIDPQTETQDLNNDNPIEEQCNGNEIGNGVAKNESILQKFKSEVDRLQGQEMKVYEEFIQSWFLKTHTKMRKLNEWEKTIHWFSRSCVNSQKNKIAELLKNTQTVKQ